MMEKTQTKPLTAAQQRQRDKKRRGVKAEMHIYPEGGHGFWMRERYKYGDETYPAVIRWIERHRTNN